MSILSIYAHIEWAFHRKAVVCFLVAITTQLTFAQSENRAQLPSAVPAADKTSPVVRAPTHNRPKIGLVLSGGGARGLLAHVGVLKALEAARKAPSVYPYLSRSISAMTTRQDQGAVRTGF